MKIDLAMLSVAKLGVVTAKTYLAFHVSRLVHSEVTAEVSSRGLSTVVMPKNAEYFWFYDRLYLTVNIGEARVELASGSVNSSPRYYPQARLLRTHEIVELDEKGPMEAGYHKRLAEAGHKFVLDEDLNGENLYASNVLCVSLTDHVVDVKTSDEHV